jgi:hypothetical protein
MLKKDKNLESLSHVDGRIRHRYQNFRLIVSNSEGQKFLCSVLDLGLQQ